MKRNDYIKLVFKKNNDVALRDLSLLSATNINGNTIDYKCDNPYLKDVNINIIDDKIIIDGIYLGEGSFKGVDSEILIVDGNLKSKGKYVKCVSLLSILANNEIRTITID